MPFLKPAVGRDVPDIERGGLLAAEGRQVEMTTYWQRRIDDGDVEAVETTEAERTAAPERRDLPAPAVKK